MDLLTAIKISSSGLSAQRTRLSVLSSNLANANSTRNADGSGPFQRKDPIFQEIKASEFDKTLDRKFNRLSGVKVTDIVTDQTEGQKVFKPNHPDADQDGFITMANVNVVKEIADIKNTSGSYEANVAAIRSAKDMINAALALGRE